MAAVMSQKSCLSAHVQTRRAGLARPAARRPVVVRASAHQQNKAAVMQAALIASVGAALSSPLAAEAAVTPSLNNFLLSLVAGGTVLVVIAGGITLISNFDPVNRG